MILALDTETTGLDVHHGAQPFLVTTCNDNGQHVFWTWDVDPKTRKPIIPKGDVEAIHSLIKSADYLILQNAKFDVHVLHTIIPNLVWDWSKTYDTLIAAHLLESNRPKDLSSLAVHYLADPNNPDMASMIHRIVSYEKELDEQVKEARKWVQKFRPRWRIAEIGLDEMPSASKQLYKYDMWLPRAVAKERCLPETLNIWTALERYANADSEVTLALWQMMRSLIEDRGLWKIYLARLDSLRLAYNMERRGVTGTVTHTNQIYSKYIGQSKEYGEKLVRISAELGHNLCIPKKGVNDSLRTLMLDVMKLPPQYSKKAKSDKPTLDKYAMAHYKDTLPSGSKELEFVETLLKKADVDGSIGYLKSYRKFWILSADVDGYFTLYPNFNPTGTATLRWSSNNPNSQNIKKDPDKEGFSLRSCFGPLPGREWWSIDAKNIELRIPFYESGEPEMIALFEEPDKPPYYGSNHILIFSVLWPDLWEQGVREVGLEKVGPWAKNKFKATQYQWVKNGNFAVQYGAIDRPDGTGTADRAYHKPGAQKMIASRFTKLEALNQKWIRYAEKYGYVETLPDKSVDPTRGYPLLCTRTDYGKILPTVPLNYHVQSTAMWWTMRAMYKVEEQLTEWRKDGFDGYMTMQIHDELVLDFPKRTHPKEKPSKSNLARIRIIQELMSSCGDDIGIPTPTGAEFHEVNWAQGVAV